MSEANENDKHVSAASNSSGGQDAAQLDGNLGVRSASPAEWLEAQASLQDRFYYHYEKKGYQSNALEAHARGVAYRHAVETAKREGWTRIQ